jgi:hypothetical protein
MYLAMAGVNHQPFRSRLVNQELRKPFPYPAVAPAKKPSMCVAPSTIVRRKITPGRSCTHNPENGIYEKTVVFPDSAPTPGTSRQMWLYLLPCLIGNIMPSVRSLGHKTSLSEYSQANYLTKLKYTQSRDYTA